MEHDLRHHHYYYCGAFGLSMCLFVCSISTNNNVDGRHPNIRAGKQAGRQAGEQARKQTGTISTSVRVLCDR